MKSRAKAASVILALAGILFSALPAKCNPIPPSKMALSSVTVNVVNGATELAITYANTENRAGCWYTVPINVELRFSLERSDGVVLKPRETSYDVYTPIILCGIEPLSTYTFSKVRLSDFGFTEPSAGIYTIVVAGKPVSTFTHP